MANKSDYQRYTRRIKRIKRRLEWLNELADTKQANQYDIAEISALEWAIPILEDYLRQEKPPKHINTTEEGGE